MDVLVVAAHPDDETFGCGGTLLKHASKGDDLNWLIATNVFEEHGFSSERVARRRVEIQTVGQEYGFKNIIELSYPTMKLDTIPMLDLVRRISKVINEIHPEVVYLPNRSDVHSDHRVCFEAAYACTKSFRFKSVRKVLMYECLSESEYAPALASTAFIPNYFCDISDFMQQKINILSIYESELGDHPFPRSVENVKALSTFRGATCGCRYAEAVVVLKCIC